MNAKLNFKKTCFQCGSKVDKLYGSICKECLVKERPPICEIKPMNFKICNSCKKIHWNNQLLEVDEIETMLPNIAKKKVVLNSDYVLNNVIIENFEVVGNKLIFDVIVDCDFKE